MEINVQLVKIKPESKNSSFVDWDGCIENDGWEKIIPEDNYIYLNIKRIIQQQSLRVPYITLKVARNRLKDFIKTIELNNTLDSVWIDVEDSLDRTTILK